MRRWVSVVQGGLRGQLRQASRFGVLDPEKVRGAFNLYNANVGVGTADGRYEAILWGRNLADKRTNALVFDSVFQGGSWHTWVNRRVRSD